MKIGNPQNEHIPALRALWKEAFGDPDAYLDLFFHTAFSYDRCYAVTEGKEVQAALYVLRAEADFRPIAYLYAIATRRAYRSRGLCRRLMEETHRALADAGYVGAILVPSEPSLFAFYEKMGYKTATGIHTLHAAAGEEKIPLRRVGKDEYAMARRRLLPPHSVIQEKEGLALLEKTAELYIGERIALAAREEPEGLYGIELLGDVTLAPAILATLGYAKGSFRTPGDTVPFSMYRPLLREGELFPSHFGFAFD